MLIKQLASALKNEPPNINNRNLSIYCKRFREICRQVCSHDFAMI